MHTPDRFPRLLVRMRPAQDSDGETGFQVLQDVLLDANAGVSIARVDVSKPRYKTASLVHPAILDVMLHMLRVSAGQKPVPNVPVRVHRCLVRCFGLAASADELYPLVGDWASLQKR